MLLKQIKGPCLLWAALLFLWTNGLAMADTTTHLVRPERSYWVHASLGLFTQRGYFGNGYPATEPPTRANTDFGFMTVYSEMVRISPTMSG